LGWCCRSHTSTSAGQALLVGADLPSPASSAAPAAEGGFLWEPWETQIRLGWEMSCHGSGSPSRVAQWEQLLLSACLILSCAADGLIQSVRARPDPPRMPMPSHVRGRAASVPLPLLSPFSALTSARACLCTLWARLQCALAGEKCSAALCRLRPTDLQCLLPSTGRPRGCLCLLPTVR
jgi:hypothetical protein